MEKTVQEMSWIRAIWNELSADTIKNCSKHTKILKDHDEAESFIHLTESENVNVNEERQKIENVSLRGRR